MTALHAEWTKARTVPGTAWSLLGIVALTVALGALAVSATAPGADPAKTALTGVTLGQAVVVVLAVAAVGGEYGTGMIRTTLAAVPRRLTVVAAKATVVTTLVLAAGAVAVLVSMMVGRLVLTDLPHTAGTVRAAVGSVLYLGLIAVLGLGAGLLVRDAAAAVGLVLGLLYLTPIVSALISDPEWYERLRKLSPMTAGLAVQATVDIADEPIGPWQGLGVLAAWAGGALLAGGLAFRLRDA